MKFKRLRQLAVSQGNKILVRWEKSKIVELVTVEYNGALRVTNLISKHSWIIPYNYDNDLKLEIVKEDYVSLGSLLPKLSK